MNIHVGLQGDVNAGFTQPWHQASKPRLRAYEMIIQQLAR